MIDLKNNKVNSIDYNREPFGTSENIRGQELLLADLKSILPTLDSLPPYDPTIADFIKKVDYLRRFAFPHVRPHLDDLLAWRPGSPRPSGSDLQPGKITSPSVHVPSSKLPAPAESESEISNLQSPIPADHPKNVPLFSGTDSELPLNQEDNFQSISGTFREISGINGNKPGFNGINSGKNGNISGSRRSEPSKPNPTPTPDDDSPDAITPPSDDPNLALRFVPKRPLYTSEDRAAFNARVQSLNETFNLFHRRRRGRPSPLFDLDPDLQQNVFELLENQTLEDVAAILANPIPFGLSLKTSTSALDRFRQTYPQRQREFQEAEQSRQADQILQKDDPNAFKTEFARRVKRRLLTTNLTSQKRVSSANILLNALAKLHRALGSSNAIP